GEQRGPEDRQYLAGSGGGELLKLGQRFRREWRRLRLRAGCSLPGKVLRVRIEVGIARLRSVLSRGRCARARSQHGIILLRTLIDTFGCTGQQRVKTVRVTALGLLLRVQRSQRRRHQQKKRTGLYHSGARTKPTVG